MDQVLLVTASRLAHETTGSDNLAHTRYNDSEWNSYHLG